MTPATQPRESPRFIRSPDTRRADLLAAAMSVLIEKGLAAATVADVTAAAGVSKGTFYLYFDSKQAVIDAVRERVSAELAAIFELPSAAREHEQWWELLLEGTDRLLAVQLEHQDLQRALIADHGERATAGPESAIAVLAQILAQGTRASAFAVTDPDCTARLLFNAVQGVAIHEAPRRRVGRRRLRAAVRAMVQRTVAPTTALRPPAPG
jgi:AcrR family transcriptional regulator